MSTKDLHSPRTLYSLGDSIPSDNYNLRCFRDPDSLPSRFEGRAEHHSQRSQKPMHNFINSSRPPFIAYVILTVERKGQTRYLIALPHAHAHDPPHQND